MAVARINVPKTARRGEIIEIRTLIFNWQGDNGFRHRETARITVE